MHVPRGACKSIYAMKPCSHDPLIDSCVVAQASFVDTEPSEDQGPQETDVAWGSPSEDVEDIDLVASDKLDDGDLEHDEPESNAGSSTCSSSRSEGL